MHLLRCRMLKPARLTFLLRGTWGLLAFVSCFLSVSPSLAGTFVAFGPQSYTRATGDPVTVTKTFVVLNPNTTYTLQINNGGLMDGQFDLVSSSLFTLNGIQIVGPNEFSQKVTVLQKPITLSAQNQLDVQVRGKPGGGLTVQVIGVDNDPPTITASISPPANAAGWNNTNVTVTFTCADSTSGIAGCPSPITVQTEGAGQVISGMATDKAGNTASVSVTLNIDKTAPAVVAAVSPAPNGAGWNRADTTVSFTATDPLSGIASVSPQTLLTHEGANQIVTGTAMDKAGNTATASVSLSLDKTPPRVQITSPANGSTLTTSPTTISGTGSDDLSGLLDVTCNGASASLSNSTFACSVSLNEGTNTIVVGATDRAGNTSSSSITVAFHAAPPPPSVSITSPADGSTVIQSSILVQGTFTNNKPGGSALEVGITVNSQVALTFGNQFFANLSISPGINTLTATATTPEGVTATHAITVTRSSTTPDPFRVIAEPQSGVAPLLVRFTITPTAGQSLQTIGIDFDGDGSVDFTTTDPNALIEHTYSNSGTYQPSVTVIDTQNIPYTATHVVVAQDAQQMDLFFTGMWSGLNQALSAGDKTTALGVLNIAAQSKYGRVFDALLPQMPQIISSYSSLQRVSISENIGEYAVNRMITGQNKIFLIYFLKDADGVWRLDSM